MPRVVSVAQTRRIEAAADTAGISYAQMMQNAGRALARRALRHLPEKLPHVLVLVGKGNNGGDGLVAARILAEESRSAVTCYLLEDRSEDPLLQAAHKAGAHSLTLADDPDYQRLRETANGCHLILDALFGIGIKLPLRDPAAELLQRVKEIIEPDRPYIIAVDCPSGFDCDSGAIDDNALSADETVTFIAAKPGLLTFPGAAHVGQIHVAPIDIPANLPELLESSTFLASTGEANALLPSRRLDANKGTFGKVLIVGGSVNYRGAVGLSGRAAYRVGAGLVTVCTASPVVDSLAGNLLELTWMPQPENTALDPADLNLGGYDALLIGPGWSRAANNSDSLRAILSAQSLPPLVVDADGLNLLSEIDHWWELLPPNTIITPHPGEMARLSGLSIPDIQANRLPTAIEKAAAWNVVLILKGAHTVIAAPDGATTILPFKTDALAKAGTGDVLAGTTAGLLAQDLAAYDAAVLAGFTHGLAGTLAAQAMGTTRSLIAGDVGDYLPAALRQIEQA